MVCRVRVCVGDGAVLIAYFYWNQIMTTKSLTFYYKKIRLKDGLTLQNILNSLNHLDTNQRTQKIGSKSYTLNHINTYQGMYYAEIVCYEKDRVQSIIHTAPVNNNLPERNITTKDIKDDNAHSTQKEFVSSRIIFGLIDNNLAIHTSRIGLQTFVNYINYLLNIYYWQNAEQAQAILITDVVTKSLKEKLKTTHVRSARIGQDVSSEPHTNNKHYFSNGSLVQKILHAIGVQDGYNQDLDDANLRLNLSLDYTRTTTKDGQKLLDDITTALATIDDSMIKIVFADGTDYTGGNIRVKGKITQHQLDDNSFDRSKLQQSIHAFLEQSLE